jgi:hypothetical protein
LMWREITLFTLDVERNHSSHLMYRGVSLHIWCEEESLFKFDV